MVELSAITAAVITLPSVTGNTGREYILIKTGVTGTVTINTAGTDTIDNGVSTTIVLSNQYDKVVVVCGSSTQWYTM